MKGLVSFWIGLGIVEVSFNPGAGIAFLVLALLLAPHEGDAQQPPRMRRNLIGGWEWPRPMPRTNFRRNLIGGWQEHE